MKSIQRIMATQTQSPMAGGNLGKGAKVIAENLPRPSSPPCSSSTMSSEGLVSRLKNLTDGVSSTLFKPSATSVENLGAYEKLVTPNGTASKKSLKLIEKESFKALDNDFMPVCLAKGREYLFASSQQTSQVQVFLGKSPQGVLKLNESKYFASLHSVHFIEMPEEVNDKLVVLDNEGFHFFTEKGMHLFTAMDKEGYKYRGLGHMVWKDRLCLVTLDINGDGVRVLLMDLNEKSDTYRTFIKR